MQTAGAFARVDAALSFFIDRYSTLADYKAVCDRLNSFDASIDAAAEIRASSAIVRAAVPQKEIEVPALTLALPDGKPLIEVDALTLKSGEHTLLTGPSGSGKSTLFRAIAGIWPFGDGRIELPTGQRVLMLPQRPYIPVGTLRAAISYPATEGSHEESTILAALEAVKLPGLAARLDEEANWSQILSGGEQQRLAIARALLDRPAWLFLDEATSALDEPMERTVYEVMQSRLPETTIVSIGHRSSLIALHARQITLVPGSATPFRVATVGEA